MNLSITILGIILCIIGIRSTILQVRVTKLEKDLDTLKVVVSLDAFRRWANSSEKNAEEKQMIDEVDKKLSAFIDKIMEENK